MFTRKTSQIRNTWKRSEENDSKNSSQPKQYISPDLRKFLIPQFPSKEKRDAIRSALILCKLKILFRSKCGSCLKNHNLVNNQKKYFASCFVM